MKEKTVEKQKRQQERWAQIDQKDLADFVNAALTQPQGRKYLRWLLRIGKVGNQPFAANALVTSFNCGELNVGQQIYAHILETNPAGYVRMMEEQADEHRERAAALNALGDTERRGYEPYREPDERPADDGSENN